MADMPAAGSEAIAARCGLNERYVREWLGAMVSSGVVDYDPRDGTYALPPEQTAFLTRAATPANLAVYAQYIPLLGAVEDDVFACFRAGGGVACLTHSSSASMRSCPKTAARPCCRC
jgi:DNA-binding IclR family transcriptional regulator